MSLNSPRMRWPYPTREDDPWFDKFEDFIRANDASGFAMREDRSIIWTGGGTLTWTLGTSTLDWTGTINVYSPIGAHLLQVEASSIAGWADGEMVYVVLTRQPLENITASLVKASQLPSTDNAMALAVRIGSVIYFRTGISLGDGDSSAGLAPVPGGGGADPNAIHDNVPAEIAGIAPKVAPTTSDLLVIEDAADANNKKRITVGTLPTGVDPAAIHDNVAAEIAGIAPKAAPIAADLIVIEDSAVGNIKKSVQVGNLPVPTHSASHQDGGTDEISVTDLSGLLADPQTPLGHHLTHESGGGDAVKLDDLATPDDNTDLDSTILRHGLLPKLGGGAVNYLRADGTWALPPGGGASVRAAPRILVGNGPNGDTGADCDFLDIGDCAGLAAAILASGPGNDVYIKPGTYDFGQVGSPVARIIIPAGVRVRGAGRKHVTIQTRTAAGDGRALLLGGDGAALEDLRVLSPEPVGLQTAGYGLVEVDSTDCELRRVDVEFDWTVTAASFNKVEMGLYVDGPFADFRMVDCKFLDVPKFYQEIPSSIMYGFFISGVGWADLRGIHVFGGDTGGAISDSPCEFHDMLFDEASAWSNIIGGRFIQDGTWPTARGLQAGANSHYISFTDLSFQVTGAAVCQAAIYTFFSDRSVIKGCRGDGKWTGNGFIRFDSSSDYNLAIANQFNGNAPSDIGSNNEFQHNIP